MKRLALLLLLCLPQALPGQCGPNGCSPWGPSQAAGRPPHVDVSRSQDAPVPANIVAASVRVRADGCGGSGTCVCVANGCGIVITNSHVVSGGRPTGTPTRNDVQIEFPGRQPVFGKLVRRDTRADLAAVLISADQNTPFVPVTATVPASGMAVWQVGYPGGRMTRRQGTVVGYQSTRSAAVNFCASGDTLFLPSFPIDHGDSGSGVFLQSDGRLCGVMWGAMGLTPGRMHSVGVQIYDVQEFMAQVLNDVNIFSPNRRQQPQQQPPAQVVQPAPPGAPAYPAPPSADPGLAAQVAQQGQQINSHAGMLSKLQQDFNDFQSRHTLTLSAVEGRVSNLKDVADKVAPLLSKLPDLEAKLKALEQNPEVQKIPVLANGLDRVVAVLDKAQPVLAQVGALQQQVKDASQGAQQAQQAAQGAQQTAQQGVQQAQAAHAKFPALEAAVKGFQDTSPVLGLFGPWGLLASAGVGLGAGALAWRKNQNATAAGAPPQTVNVNGGGPDLSSLLAAVGGQAQQNMLKMAAQGVLQGLSGNQGSMKQGA